MSGGILPVSNSRVAHSAFSLTWEVLTSTEAEEIHNYDVGITVNLTFDTFSVSGIIVGEPEIIMVKHPCTYGAHIDMVGV